MVVEPTPNLRETMHMTTQEDFTEEEWASVQLLPVLALSGSVLADGRKLVTSFSETIAGMGAFKEASAAQPDNALVQAIAAALESSSGKQAVNLSPENAGTTAEAVTQISDQIQAAVDIVRAKASPEEFEGLKAVLITTAQTAAERKGSGPMGFGGDKVDANEQAFLDKLNAMLNG